MQTRIICIGNRLIPEDCLGPKVYDYLAGYALPSNVTVIDGGLFGLDLLRFVEGAHRIVFVDTISGYENSGTVLVLDVKEAMRDNEPEYGHSGNLAYLLKIIPTILEDHEPEIYIVGSREPADELVSRIADMCLKLAGTGEITRSAFQEQ